MSMDPLLSYIVLSYNYERYIGKTLQSIFDQTVQDFEIVVVDDCSTDNSVEIVLAIKDARIRLFKNERNLGGAASYNRAVLEARGKWLVNLDADDWIDPRKAEIQLKVAASDPRLDVIGSHVTIYDEDDNPHPSSDVLEAVFNNEYDLNLVDTWIGANHLCRSSTMVRAIAHKQWGLDDPSMIRAPDYELWTRALRDGCRFAVVPQRLTFIRAHSRGVTHGDPVSGLLELSYAMQRNLVPLAATRSLFNSVARIVAWACRHPSLSQLPPVQAHRLIGALMQPAIISNYQHFLAMLTGQSDHFQLAELGRRLFAFVGPDADAYQEVRKLHNDIQSYIDARDYFKNESEKWELAFKGLQAEHQIMSASLSLLNPTGAQVFVKPEPEYAEHTMSDSWSPAARQGSFFARVWTLFTRLLPK
ncbi:MULTISPECIES: glycosyltransferase family 2 protein [unclassified Variovorax]|uniref:glycosyltransferase family 2 protein n=1 Tax=unclassified Variovorax TaxID=663243 RepID=UPI000D130EFB|nr:MULTISPECIES: glycosyltransferase family 2 protein [unclassified Variovorax]AVQ82223.1 glycosyltransferase family 2 protein [Variovorax sp. PMC12]QRY33516.1 glycosyltransferase family 2 protein [Variovorax sp. PDNC026]